MLTGQSSSLVLQEFQVAKYQALASLQYMGCLLLFPWGLSILIKEPLAVSKKIIYSYQFYLTVLPTYELHLVSTLVIFSHFCWFYWV